MGRLIYSMSVSVDGFITDREGGFDWSGPSEEQFRSHITQTRELGAFLLGRWLYETMLVWETDLPPVTEDVPLELIETRTFDSRVIYERCERARPDSG